MCAVTAWVVTYRKPSPHGWTCTCEMRLTDSTWFEARARAALEMWADPADLLVVPDLAAHARGGVGREVRV